METQDGLSGPRVALILGSFFVLTIPLAVLTLVSRPDLFSPAAAWIFRLLGISHFALTPFAYLNSANRRHFLSSGANKLKYWAAPAFCAGCGFLIAFNARFPGRAKFGFVAMGSLSAFHVLRQSTGVLQILKRRTGAAFPAWSPAADNLFFLSMFILQASAFAGQSGVLRLDAALLRALTAAAAVLWACSAAGLALSFASARPRAALLVPAAYFLLQSASAALPLYSLSLSVAALAMHYTEYHVLMWPRCFRSNLDLSEWSDRLLVRLGKHPWIFYAGLCGLTGMSDSAGRFQPWIDGLLTGLFLAHFLLDGFWWRLSEPYYRDVLKPLFFGGSPAV